MPSSGRGLDRAVILRSRRRRRIPRSEVGVFGKQTREDALSSKTICQSKVNRFFPIFLFGKHPKKKDFGEERKNAWVGSRHMYAKGRDTMYYASFFYIRKRCIVCRVGLEDHSLLSFRTSAHTGEKSYRLRDGKGPGCEVTFKSFVGAGVLNSPKRGSILSSRLAALVDILRPRKPSPSPLAPRVFRAVSVGSCSFVQII